MNASFNEGKIDGPTPEELAVATLTAAAQSALDFRKTELKPMPGGGSSRAFTGGNHQATCDLGELIFPDGTKTYIFNMPRMVKTELGVGLVGLHAQWNDGDDRVTQRIVSGDVTEFEPIKPGDLAKALTFHLDDPTLSERSGSRIAPRQILRKIGDVILRR